MISNFEFRISDFPPAHPRENGRAGRELKTQNSKLKTAAALLLFSVFIGSGCSHQVRAPKTTTPTGSQGVSSTPPVEPVEEGWTEKGNATWYGEPSHGRRTASGEINDMHQMTAAHKTLAFGSMVKVNRRDTGADVVVRINDRGPFIEGRIIDLSYAAAQKIGLDIDGVAPAKIKVVGHEKTPRSAAAPAPAAESRECFWVQVGAFSERHRAGRVEAELESTGERATDLEGIDDLWRVRLGPFDNQSEAERTRTRVTDAWPGAHITPCGG